MTSIKAPTVAIQALAWHIQMYEQHVNKGLGWPRLPWRALRRVR